MSEHSLLIKISKNLITILTPIVILMISIRILITPYFAMIEYQMPGFPEDPFGFSLEDRLRWSEPSIRYLVNNEDIDYLADLRFDNGDPIFNTRELSHMADVKSVVLGMRMALAIFAIILVVSSFILVGNDQKGLLIKAYHSGGWGIIGLIAVILFMVAISFNQLFTWFHKIFFVEGSWRFYTSDTLIRLFPMRFWQDAFIFVGVLSLVVGVIVIITTGPKKESGGV